ncbi:MAG: GAP family protein [Thermoleophilia bacterium]
MARTLLEILPLVLAAALSPTSLVMVITILGGKGDARRNSLLFVTGGAIFLVLFGLAVMLVFNHVVIPIDYKGRLSFWIDIVLGAAIILLVFRSFFGKEKQDRKDKAGNRPYLVVGFLMMLINSSTEVPFMAACKIITEARLPLWDAAILFSLQVIITMSLLSFPVALSYVAPRRSAAVLDRFGALITRYGNLLVKVIFLLVGAYLIWRGVRALA